DGVKAYLTHLLDGVVPAGDIVVMHPFAVSPSSDSEPSLIPHAVNDDQPVRPARFPWQAHLHKVAAAGAMLTCIAVVLNVGPFAKPPKIDGATFNLASVSVPVASPVPATEPVSIAASESAATEQAQAPSSVAQQAADAGTSRFAQSTEGAGFPALART